MSSAVLHSFAELLRYPGEERGCRVFDWIETILAEEPGLASDLEPLGAFLGESGQSELEELFVRTFENNKERALELGWHLHGENYARGSFMARVRGLLRELGVEESIELPDHVSHLLAVVERAEPDVARSFATRVIDPALTKVLEGFHSSENPYRGVVRSLRAYLRTLYPEQSPIQVGSSSHE